MESWRKVWRNGFAPLIVIEWLTALRDGLRDDDKRIVQGQTAIPPVAHSVRDWPLEAADALTFCGWQGSGHGTVGEGEEYFALLCYRADQVLGEPAGCRWFLNWYDDTPRDQMRCDLLAEVELELAKRIGEQPGSERCPFCDGTATPVIDDIWKCGPCDRTWSPRVMVLDDGEADLVEAGLADVDAGRLHDHEDVKRELFELGGEG